MAVKVADAIIPLVLDLSEFENQLAYVEQRLADINAQIDAAASAANSISVPSGGGGGGGGFFGRGNSGTNFSTLGPSISGAMDPNSPGGRGWTLGEDITASLQFVAANAIPGVSKGGATIGTALMQGVSGGISTGSSDVDAAMSQAVASAIDSGMQAAGISSPSKVAADMIGSPISQGVAMGISSGTPAITAALSDSVRYAINDVAAAVGGGTHVASNVTTVTNPGGPVGGYIDPLISSTQASIALANPTNPTELSRAVLGQFPGVQNAGDRLVEGAANALLPGWAAGPASDIIGTAIGTQPIISADAAMSPGVSADMGGFSDSPYSQGSYVINNTYNMPRGNFTDTELAVQQGTLEAMYRLGAY